MTNNCYDFVHTLLVHHILANTSNETVAIYTIILYILFFDFYRWTRSRAYGIWNSIWWCIIEKIKSTTKPTEKTWLFLLVKLVSTFLTFRYSRRNVLDWSCRYILNGLYRQRDMVICVCYFIFIENVQQFTMVNYCLLEQSHGKLFHYY